MMAHQGFGNKNDVLQVAACYRVNTKSIFQSIQRWIIIKLVLLFLISVPRTEAQSARIVFGEPAKKDEYPAFVALLQNRTRADGRDKLLCGGSLLSKRVVLTAAHCVDLDIAPESKNFKVARGNIRLSKLGSGAFKSADEISEVEKVIIHPNFPRKSRDIALVILQKDMPKPYMKVAKAIPKYKSKVTVMGFGRNENVRYFDAVKNKTVPGHPSKLYKVGLRLGAFGKYPCPTTVYGETEEKGRELCVYGYEPGTTGFPSPCNGDSGSPLLDGNGHIIGLASRGIPANSEENLCQTFWEAFTLFSNVPSHYKSFIEPILKKYS